MTCVKKFDVMRNFDILFMVEKLQLFYQLQYEVEKVHFFWNMQHTENHCMLLKIKFLYFHEFLSKLHAYKLIWKVLALIFQFCKKNWFYASACIIPRSMENIFWKFDIFILRDQNFQNDPTIMVFQEPKHQKHRFSIQSIKLTSACKKIGLEKWISSKNLK